MAVRLDGGATRYEGRYVGAQELALAAMVPSAWSSQSARCELKGIGTGASAMSRREFFVPRTGIEAGDACDHMRLSGWCQVDSCAVLPTIGNDSDDVPQVPGA